MSPSNHQRENPSTSSRCTEEYPSFVPDWWSFSHHYSLVGPVGLHCNQEFTPLQWIHYCDSVSNGGPRCVNSFSNYPFCSSLKVYNHNTCFTVVPQQTLAVRGPCRRLFRVLLTQLQRLCAQPNFWACYSPRDEPCLWRFQGKNTSLTSANIDYVQE